MPFRPEFRNALALLVTAIRHLRQRGREAPILVGGAAVELFTGGAITSGDFDFVSPHQDEFFAELLKLGFERPTQPGWLTRSLFHPTLGFGVQVVSGQLMDGRAEKNRILVLDTAETSEGQELAWVIPVEDLIADRMAQAFAGSAVRNDMKNQAVRLYQFAELPDHAYLDKRIRTETADEASLATLQAWSHESDKA